MNILSLPDEMLSSVFKYSCSETLTKLRKLSSKIDNVARGYSLNKCRIDKITIFYENEVFNVILNWKGSQSKVRREHASKTLLQVLELYGSKIYFKHLNELVISHKYHRREMIISKEVLQLLSNCKNLYRLSIYQSEIKASLQLVRKMLTNMKLTELMLFASFEEFELSDELIDGLQLESLILKSVLGTTKISLPCLAKLCDNRIPSILHCKIQNSTATELGGFFEKYLQSDVMKKLKHWTIEIDRGNMSMNEVQEYFKNLKCFFNYHVELFAFGNDGFFIRKRINLEGRTPPIAVNFNE